jgi:uncharacterized membrane protein
MESSRLKTRIPHPRAVYERPLTFGERVADAMAEFGGSWTFLLLFFAGIGVWILWNQRSATPFDPYPFILLNVVLSCVAAVQAPVIMMSQNRQEAKDRLEAHQDYEVNLHADHEIATLHQKIDRLEQLLQEVLKKDREGPTN